MHELKQVAENTFYLKGSTNIGFCLTEGGRVYLIDSGDNDEDAKRVLQVLEDRDWKLQAVINTHSHPDHVGGNNYLQLHTGCRTYCCPGEAGYVNSPLDPSTIMYGAYASREISVKCVKSKPCVSEHLTEAVLPEGFQLMSLPGHAVEMYGIKSPDGVWFLADSLVSESYARNFHLAYLYHAGDYIKTLENLKTIEGEAFVPSHASASREIARLCQVNIEEVFGIMDLIMNICREPKTLDEVLKRILDTYGCTMDYNIYLVVGSLIRSYTSYMHDAGMLEGIFEDNRLLWRAVR